MPMEISRCFPWLSRHRQGKKWDSFETLLDDVVVDVLSRLEVDQLGRTKRICRRWRALIGTVYFTRVHLQRASSVTVMWSMFSERRAVDMPFFFYYDWGAREKIRGATYRLLSYRETPNGFSYHGGGLGPAAWEEGAPSGVKGRLHWMVVGKERMPAPCLHSIMVFSTGESEFRFMPLPGDTCLSSHGHSNMHLVERNGRVYVFAIRVEVMCVWVLEDYASWHWLVDSPDGELLPFGPRKGFFRYNLRSETITKVDFSKYGLKSRTSVAMSRVAVAECKTSLVSLKDLQ
ncbi:hypothetical protein NL676_019796 [Syzygium grande]|nr:hypothetical protein NL676_019796 [Syzygium grande]